MSLLCWIDNEEVVGYEFNFSSPSCLIDINEKQFVLPRIVSQTMVSKTIFTKFYYIVDTLMTVTIDHFHIVLF